MCELKDCSIRLTNAYLRIIMEDIRLRDLGPDAPVGDINTLNRARHEATRVDEDIRIAMKNRRTRRVPVDADPDADCR